jgi:hypothetical protein
VLISIVSVCKFASYTGKIDIKMLFRNFFLFVWKMDMEVGNLSR